MDQGKYLQEHPGVRVLGSHVLDCRLPIGSTVFTRHLAAGNCHQFVPVRMTWKDAAENLLEQCSLLRLSRTELHVQVAPTMTPLVAAPVQKSMSLSRRVEEQLA